MKKRVFAVLTCLSMLCSTQCIYAEETMLAAYNAENDEVTVSGMSDEAIVTVVIVKGEEAFESLNDENLPICLEPIEVLDGSFLTVLGMPEDAENGKYTIYLKCKNEIPLKDSFVYINTTEAENLLQRIKREPENFISIVSENETALGIDTTDEFYNENKSKILNLLNVIKGNYKKPAELYNDIYQSYALIFMGGKSTSQVAQCLEKYEKQLGINFDEYITNDLRLPAKTREELLLLLSKKDYADTLEKKSLLKVFEEEKLLAAVKTAENGIALQKIMEETFKDDFSTLLTNDKYYSKISTSNRYKIYSSMMTYNFGSFEAIAENFGKASKAVYDLQNNEKKDEGTHGGGISGGTGISTSITTKEPDSITENEGTQGGELNITFSDLEASNWAYKSVSSLAAAGIVNGYVDGSFKPDNKVSRAEFTKLITEACKDLIVYDETEVSFEDVTDGSWYNEAVVFAASAGIVRGYEGKFSPEANIKREDAAVIIYNALKAMNIEITGIPSYTDKMEISAYAYTAAGALLKYKLMTGNDDAFRPLDAITRAEAAQMIYNMITWLNTREQEV